MTGSWRTSLVGYIAILSGLLGLIADIIVTQGVPQTMPEYFVFGSMILGGVGHILSKDANVSNSPHPVSATEVTPSNEAKSNPSAPIAVVLLCAFALTAGCSGGPGVKMEPFTTDEVNVLVHAAVATYLMERNVQPDVALKASAYVETVRNTITTGDVDLSALRVQVVDKVPARWQPLAAATWVILLKRINLEQLIADGKHAEARAYIDAAMSGALTALKGRAGA